VTEGYTKEQVEQNIEKFTDKRNDALYNLYENKRETLASMRVETNMVMKTY
jgi:hypothetical protein